ncbi:MAG: class I SAM-dependent methyltransferase [Hyphomicrobium sp.]
MAKIKTSKLIEGYDIYSPLVLRFYDLFVLAFSNRFLWKCPKKELVSLYNRNVTDDHLDIGVGTGYYLSVARFPSSHPHVTLVDRNINSLSMAARRIEHLKPSIVLADVMYDLPLVKNYSSVSMCYLLHCLSGGIKIKSQVFDRVSTVLKDGGRVFGATIVPDHKELNYVARPVLKLYNKIGIFSNIEDTMEDLKIEFEKRFSNSQLQRVGSVVLFEGIVRK